MEGDDPAGADRDLLAGLRIAAGALRLIAELEVTEAGELDALAALERPPELLKKRLDHILGLALVQADLLEQKVRQLGLRMVMEDEFHTLWWVPETAHKDDVRAYLRGLDRAEKSLNLNLPKYLPLWEKCVPPEFKHVHKWDYSRFTRGERFVFKPIPRTEFDETLAQVKRWQLDQYLNEKSFDKLTYRI